MHNSAGNIKLYFQEYCLPFGLALADAIYGATNIISGIRRNWIVITHAPERSALECMLEPHTTLFLFSITSSSLIQAALSIDRFMATAFFRQYMSWTFDNGMKLVYFFFAFALLSTEPPWFLTLTQTDNETKTASPICMVPDPFGLPEWYLLTYALFQMVCYFSSIIVYLLVAVCLWYRLKQTENDSEIERQKKRQVEATKTVSIIIVSLFFLCVVVQAIQTKMLKSPKIDSVAQKIIVGVAKILKNFHFLIVLAVYYKRNLIVRKSINEIVGRYCLFGRRITTKVKPLRKSTETVLNCISFSGTRTKLTKF